MPSPRHVFIQRSTWRHLLHGGIMSFFSGPRSPHRSDSNSRLALLPPSPATLSIKLGFERLLSLLGASPFSSNGFVDRSGGKLSACR
jgi:hypothetical protein